MAPLTHDFNAAILNATDHRPWPLPSRPWAMTQTWHNLLFAHWPVDPSQLRSKVPDAFALDLFDGVAWVGVVPFEMTNVAPRWVPSLPWVSHFAELNVRTYVRVEDRPGVFFFSLDAANALAVRTARALLNLPYFSASMSVAATDANVRYLSRRQGAHHNAQFDATYRPTGPSAPAADGSLVSFLVERYCLYHIDRRGRPYRLEIHHPPWALQPAEADVRSNTMAAVNGITLPTLAPLLHFARRQDMVAWLPSRLMCPS